MPEGPETARSLRLLLSQLQKDGKYPYLVNFVKLSGHFPAVDIQSLLPVLDQRLLDVFSKGKEYFFVFPSPLSTPANPERIAVRAHHGMKGHWSFSHPTSLANSHFRLDFSWDLASFQTTQTPDLYLYYYNERFGQFEVLPSLRSLQDSLMRLGMDFLGTNPPTLLQWQFSWGQLTKTRLLRSVLMDQTDLCCGIGNYLLAEIFYYARFHPDIKIGQVSEGEVNGLFTLIQTLLHGHSHKKLEKVVYKRKFTPEGHPIENVTRSGRKIWYVPALQLLRA